MSGSRSLLDELPDVLTNVYLILTTIFGTLRLVLLVGYCRRFSVFPIKDRWPIIGVIVQLGILFFTEIWMYEIYDWENFPCWLDAFASHFLLFLTCAVFAMRALGLYWNYNKCVEALEAERESLRQLQVNRSPSRRRKWFLERRWIGSPSTLQIFICILAFCHFIEFLATTTISNVSLTTTMPNCSLGDRYIKLGIVIFYATFCIFLALDMRTVADNFFIKNELALVGWATSFGAFGWFLFDLLLTNINRKSALSLVVLYIASLIIYYASILYPLNKALKKGILGTPLREILFPQEIENPGHLRESKYTLAPSRLGTSELPIDTATFTTILNDPEACDSFSQFLIRELNVENLLFYQAVTRYRLYCLAMVPSKISGITGEEIRLSCEAIPRSPSLETEITILSFPKKEKLTPYNAYIQSLDQATQMMTRFIRTNGELQVNLPSLIVDTLEERYEQYRAPSLPPPLTSVRSLPKLFGKNKNTPLSLVGGSERTLSPIKSKTTWQLKNSKNNESVEIDRKTTTQQIRWEDIKLISELFDEAQQEIFRLMRYDPFQRFARTEEGIKMRTKLASSPSSELSRKLDTPHSSYETLRKGETSSAQTSTIGSGELVPTKENLDEIDADTIM